MLDFAVSLFSHSSCPPRAEGAPGRAASHFYTPFRPQIASGLCLEPKLFIRAQEWGGMDRWAAKHTLAASEMQAGVGPWREGSEADCLHKEKDLMEVGAAPYLHLQDSSAHHLGTELYGKMFQTTNGGDRGKGD